MKKRTRNSLPTINQLADFRLAQDQYVCNPFVSKAQRRACYAADDPDWDCEEWGESTPDDLPERKGTANANPEGCNQWTGPSCSSGGGSGLPEVKDVRLPEQDGEAFLKDKVVSYTSNPTKAELIALLATHGHLRGLADSRGLVVWPEKHATHEAMAGVLGKGARFVVDKVDDKVLVQGGDAPPPRGWPADWPEKHPYFNRYPHEQEYGSGMKLSLNAQDLDLDDEDETKQVLTPAESFPSPVNPTTAHHLSLRKRGLKANSGRPRARGNGPALAPNAPLLKLDPTRTATMRRAFMSKLMAKFTQLKERIEEVIGREDALGLGQVRNIEDKANLSFRLADAARRAKKGLDVGPDYQRLFATADGQVWWVSADGDEEEDVQKIKAALEAVEGVESVRLEAEVSPKDRDAWKEITWNCAPGQMRGADGRCGPGVGKSIPREKMPQIKTDDLKGFLDWADVQGVKVSRRRVPANELSPAQGQFRQERVNALPEEALEQPILISEDECILDGTHRWVKHWQRGKEGLVPVIQLGLPLEDALDLMKDFPRVKFAANARTANPGEEGPAGWIAHWPAMGPETGWEPYLGRGLTGNENPEGCNQWTGPGCGAGGKAKQTDSKEFKEWFKGSKVVDAEGKPLVVFHGTTSHFEEFASTNPDPHANLDEMLGSHFAEDHTLSETFLKGRGSWGEEEWKQGGVMMPVYLSVKNPRLAPQRMQDNGELEHDATAINREILSMVMPHEKGLFTDWITKARRVTREQGEEIFDRLNRGESIGNHEYNKVAGHDLKSKYRIPGQPAVASYVSDYDGGLNMMSRDQKQYVVSKYKSKLAEMGHDGIQYTDTAPMEKGEKSQKAWIAFTPGQIKSATGNRGTFDPKDPLITHAFQAPLTVPVVRQSKPWSCGAAALASVTRLSEGLCVKLLGSSPRDGTRPQALVRVLEAMERDPVMKVGMTLAELTEATRQGQPVICAIQDHGTDREEDRTESGHWVVVTQAERGLVSFMDPAQGSRTLDEEEFQGRWRDFDADGNWVDKLGIMVRGRPTLNANPEGCNQFTGPGCNLGGEVKSGFKELTNYYGKTIGGIDLVVNPSPKALLRLAKSAKDSVKGLLDLRDGKFYAWEVDGFVGEHEDVARSVLKMSGGWGGKITDYARAYVGIKEDGTLRVSLGESTSKDPRTEKMVKELPFRVSNTFCPTGSGGGIDATCSPKTNPQGGAEGEYGPHPKKGIIGKLWSTLGTVTNLVPGMKHLKAGARGAVKLAYLGLEKRYGKEVSEKIVAPAFFGGYGVAAAFQVTLGFPGIPVVNDVIAAYAMAGVYELGRGAAKLGKGIGRLAKKLTGNEDELAKPRSWFLKLLRLSLREVAREHGKAVQEALEADPKKMAQVKRLMAGLKQVGNSNPEGCNQHTGPGCSTGAEEPKGWMHRAAAFVGRMADKVPLVKRARTFFAKQATKLYKWMEGRYGRTAAIAALASGQAIAWGSTGLGALMGKFVWLPFSTLWGPLPAVGLMELAKRLGLGFRDKKPAANLAASDRGQEFWDKYIEACHGWVKNNEDQIRKLGDVTANSNPEGHNQYSAARFGGMVKPSARSINKQLASSSMERVKHPVKLTQIPVSSLKPTEPVLHPPKTEDLKKAMSNGKDVPPLLVTRKNEVLDGHHRLEAAKQLEFSHVWALKEVGKGKHLQITNTRWASQPDPDKIRAFQQWLEQQMRQLFLSPSDEQLWARYAEDGFRKGAGRAFDDAKMQDLRRRRPELFTPQAQDQLRDFYAGSKDEFLRSAFAHPVSVEKVKLLAGRTFDEMRNVTRDMSHKMSRALTNGLVQGKSPRDVARDLNKEADLGQHRSLTVARTELTRVHASGQLTAMRRLGVDRVGVAVEWSVSGLGVTRKGNLSPCPACEPLEGIVLSLDEAEGLLPRHPNCMCSFIPAGVGEDGGNQKLSKVEIEDAIEESLEEGGTDWAGEELEVSKRRPTSNRRRVRESLPRGWVSNERTAFFADCERDEHGRCLPENEFRVSGKELKQARKLALNKVMGASEPTADEAAEANRRINQLGADKYESQIRGNVQDRARSRQRLLHEFGDGEHCPCVYCGLKLDASSVTRDKIYTAREGGRYRQGNLLPACLGCNQKRGDVKAKEIRWSSKL